MICLGCLDSLLKSISWAGVEKSYDQLLMSAMKGGWGFGRMRAMYLPVGISVDFGSAPSFDDPLSFCYDPFFPYKLPRKAHF